MHDTSVLFCYIGWMFYFIKDMSLKMFSTSENYFLKKTVKNWTVWFSKRKNMMINIAFCKSNIIFYSHFTLNTKEKIINYLEPGQKALMIHEL